MMGSRTVNSLPRPAPPLWTETVRTDPQLEKMLLPRLPAYAELGWSAPEGKNFAEFATRLADQAERWSASNLTFTHDPTIPWNPSSHERCCSHP